MLLVVETSPIVSMSCVVTRSPQAPCWLYRNVSQQVI